MGDKWSERFGSEWGYVMQLGSAIIDPHEKKEFWENIKRMKNENESFSIYSIFPKKQCSTEAAMRECCSYVKSLRRPGTEEESA